MSLTYTKDLNFNGTSVLKATKSTESDTIIMSMNSNYNSSGVNFHKYIENVELYEVNKEMVDADYTEFEQKVYDTLGFTSTEEASK